MALSGARFWYLGTTKWTAVSIWTTLTATTAGTLRRQTAALGTLTVGNERVFVALNSSVTTGATEPTWVLTKGAKTTDATVTWMECTGQAGVNGDFTNCPKWTNNAKGNAIVQGDIIQDDSGVGLQICTTAGTAGSGAQPSFSSTAGTTTADNTVTWTSLGVVAGFAAYAAPHARLKNVITSTWMTDGDTCYISNNHAETQTTALSLPLLGISSTPSNYICVSDTVAPPTTTATTASITTTGTANITLGVNISYVYGVKFSAGSTTNGNISATASTSHIYDTCTFSIPNTGAGAEIIIGTGNVGGFPTYYNCTFVFGAATQQLVPNGVTVVGGTFAATGTVPTTLFLLGTSGQNYTIIRDCDFSNISSNIADVSNISLSSLTWFENCKIKAGANLTVNNAASLNTTRVHFHNCDSSATSYRTFYKYYSGTLQQETSIVRTGGASDGTTPISWNIASASQVTLYYPFISEEITIWNDITGSSKTATVEINSGGTLTNGDVWMELEYLGNSGAPLGSFTSTRKSDILQSNTNITSSTAVWGGGLAGSTTQKLQVTFTPQLKGPVKARIYVGKPSQTVYVDPRLTISDSVGNIQSSGRQFLIPGWGYGNETAPSLKQFDLSGGMFS